jgi:hypothetical protein
MSQGCIKMSGVGTFNIDGSKLYWIALNDQIDDHHEGIDEIFKWCYENIELVNTYAMSRVIHLKNKDDFTLFMLRWS